MPIIYISGLPQSGFIASETSWAVLRRDSGGAHGYPHAWQLFRRLQKTAGLAFWFNLRRILCPSYQIRLYRQDFPLRVAFWPPPSFQIDLWELLFYFHRNLLHRKQLKTLEGTLRKSMVCHCCKHQKPEMLLCKHLSLLEAVLIGNVFAKYHNSNLTFHGDPAQRKVQS